jgi:phenylpropionate dioxygenase-like ring-hydroxylating dioxygenase large terminal subunit
MSRPDLRQLINDYIPNHTLAQAFYTDQSIFDVEWDKIWSKLWLFAGAVAQIPNSGDYFLYKLKNESIIIIRGDEGNVYAHYNTCSHRGSLICLESQGNASRFTCPYHNWVFDKNGSLIKARLMPSDFDASAHGLKPVHVEVVEGFIFISIADEPYNFDVLRKDFTPYLRPFNATKAKIAATASYTLRTNWKLVGENFRECYHCGPAHPEYCSAVIGANLYESAAETLAEKIPIWESKGLATATVPFRDDTHHFAVRYPLRDGIKSYSTDGYEASSPMGSHEDHDAGVLGMVTYPNFWMDAVSDYMWTMRLTAIDHKTTVIDLMWLVDYAAIEGLDYETEKLISFWKITGEQDWKLCENNYSGIESSRYSPGLYAPDEADVAKYIEWYLNQMKS